MMSARMSMLILGAVLVTGVAMPAQAGWDLTKKERSEGKSYCAVSKYFDQTIVTVGRSVNDQSSMALEFPDTRFDPVKKYTVSIKPGNDTRFDVEVKPQSARVLVINLDRVIDLQQSLDVLPVMQVKIDEKNLTFALAGWDQASRDLTACLASLDVSQSRDIAVVPVKPPVEERVTPTPPKKVESVDEVAVIEPLPARIPAAAAPSVPLGKPAHPQTSTRIVPPAVDRPVAGAKPLAVAGDQARLQKQIDQLIRDNTALRAQLSGGAKPSTPPALVDDVMGAVPVPVATPKNGTAPVVPDVILQLKKLPILPDTGLTPAKRNPFGSGVAYRFEEGALAGLVVQQKSSVSPDKLVGKLKSSCAGDFAAVPGPAGKDGVSIFDVACVAGGDSTHAAVVVGVQGQDVTIVSYEGAAEDAPAAMSARDRVAAGL